MKYLIPFKENKDEYYIEIPSSVYTLYIKINYIYFNEVPKEI